MTALLIGYARLSTDAQDLTAQRDGLLALGVEPNRIHVDHGLTGANRERAGLREALAACREGDTLVVTKLDRLARSLPDARAIAEELTRRQVRLGLGGSVYDPHDPVGRLLFTVLAMVAEFEADLIRLRTREGMRVAKAKGKLRGKQPELNPRQEAHLVDLFRQGEHSTAELADLLGVARSTVYRALERDRARGQTNGHRAAAISAGMSRWAQPPASTWLSRRGDPCGTTRSLTSACPRGSAAGSAHGIPDRAGSRSPTGRPRTGAMGRRDSPAAAVARLGPASSEGCGRGGASAMLWA